MEGGRKKQLVVFCQGPLLYQASTDCVWHLSVLLIGLCCAGQRQMMEQTYHIPAEKACRKCKGVYLPDRSHSS